VVRIPRLCRKLESAGETPHQAKKVFRTGELGAERQRKAERRNFKEIVGVTSPHLHSLVQRDSLLLGTAGPSALLSFLIGGRRAGRDDDFVARLGQVTITST
jgi:hypothetical protein